MRLVAIERDAGAGRKRRRDIKTAGSGSAPYLLASLSTVGSARRDRFLSTVRRSEFEDNMIELTAGDGHKFSAYRADPLGTPKGAVVVIQEVFGVNPHIRKLTDGFAANGYVAIAPSLFDCVKTNVELGYDEKSLAEGLALMQQVGTALIARRYSGNRRCRQERRQGRDRWLLLGRLPSLPRWQPRHWCRLRHRLLRWRNRG